MPLILPSAIGKRGSWDGTSDHPVVSGRTVPNKETSMNWAEHQGIVLNANKLLAGEVPEEFADLKRAYYGELGVSDTGSRWSVKIFVSKGIHQPETNPHMQLETEAQLLTRQYPNDRNSRLVPKADTPPRIWKYHLDLSAVDCKDKADSFQWVGVQFSRQVGSTIHVWPRTAVVVMKSPATTRGRRNSISSADLAAHVDALRIAAEIKAFDDLCIAFETTHQIKPIDRTLRTAPSLWVKPTYTGEPMFPTGKTVKYQYDKSKGFSVVPG
jgi:hypothetical protein